MRHQRDVVSSERRRARPRSLTSLASCRMHSWVMARYVNTAIQKRDVNFLQKLNEMKLEKLGDKDAQLEGSIKSDGVAGGKLR